jgi:hypothetical protein
LHTSLQIQLKGVAIGDGLVDPCTQVPTQPKAAFDFGLIDEKGLAKAGMIQRRNAA